jgi:hypothetical protein
MTSTSYLLPLQASLVPADIVPIGRRYGGGFPYRGLTSALHVAVVADVAARLGVDLRPDAGLLAPDDGDDDARWVLVTGRLPSFEVHGWTTPREAKRVGKRIG